MFAEWTRKALKHAKITQAEAARRLAANYGITVERAAVNKITKGKRELSARELAALVEITGYPSPFAQSGASGDPAFAQSLGGMSYAEQRYALAQFLEKLIGEGGAIDWQEIVEEFEEVFPQRRSEELTAQDQIRVQSQVDALVALAKRKLRQTKSTKP